ncbi:hypothetical protein C5167_037571 [Papaver somniferum]|uniref:Uncharacterized protein n=1 Tax=Papaver somniferum TaxID=3469 RepID=A0A4Y7IB38_PAPSO|nr:hypothetical protein C5167_037571 [Papaver somniferum]
MVFLHAILVYRFKFYTEFLILMLAIFFSHDFEVSGGARMDPPLFEVVLQQDHSSCTTKTY